jgi:OmpA-OmpF porin, OOP family
VTSTQRWSVISMLICLAACGQQDEPAPPATSIEASPESSIAQPVTPSESAAPIRTATAPGPRASSPYALPTLDEEREQVAEEMRAASHALMEARKDPSATPAQRKAAQEKFSELSVRSGQLRRYKQQPETLDLTEEWRSTYRVEKDGPEADLLIQVGDIDNLGFGWPAGFDPFEGKSTPKHPYPWRPEADDPVGTDRVMVTSGMTNRRTAHHDGYTNSTSRPTNAPVPLTIEFDRQGVEIKSAALQLFVDDFQAPKLRSRFQVKIDHRDVPDLAATLNDLEQTGPIGKLVTLQFLPEYLELLADGKLVIWIDDAEHNVGDGFAFDFARLLINPKAWRHAGVVRGVTVDKTTNAPLGGVLVSAANVKHMETGADGRFELSGVPAGLVVTSGSHPQYQGASEQRDLEAGQTIEVVLKLEKNENTSEALAQQLEKDGKVDLYGIYFDLDKATLKPESRGTLEQVLGLLKSRPTLRLIVAGHTDNEGGDDYNLALSQRRAAAVVAWLTERKIDAARLQPEGMGETQPVADNATPAGRALNRRVEIREVGSR